MQVDRQRKTRHIGSGGRRGIRQLPARAAARGVGAVERLESRRLMASTPLISEFVAVNNTGLQDETGARGDWIELHNPGAGAVNLAGYTLTDDAAVPGKWTLPSVTLQGGAFLVVFADAKNKTNPAATLHTNFSLGSGGGYLGLYAPAQTTPLSSYNYPQQVADTSYGVGVATDTTTLIGPHATSRAHVPTSGTLGTTWTAQAFDDAGWTAGTTGVGYEAGTAAPPVSGFLVRMVDTNANINSIADATALLNGTAPSYPVLFAGQATRAQVNFGGDAGGGAGTTGNAFANDLPLVNGVAGSTENTFAGREQFALRATATVTIPAGTYTINVGSDDGMRLRIPGATFFNRRNEFIDGTSASPADTLVRANNGIANTSATLTVPAGGLTTTLQLDYYDLSGPDVVELSVANGQLDAFSAGLFALLGDGARGWSVKSPQQPTPGFSVRMVDTSGGTDGNFSHIAEATAVLDGTAGANAFAIASNTTVNRPVINLGSGGYASGELTLPNGAGGNGSSDENQPQRDQYALRMTARVTIPAGTWTIAAATDDGFRLRIPGVTFAGRYNEEFSGAANPSPADTLVYGTPRGIGETSAVFTVPAGGITTTLQYDMYEAGGGDGAELWLAGGSRAGQLGSSPDFALLADGVYGWGVQDATVSANPDFTSLLGTNLLGAMRNVNASAYVRLPFSSGGPSDYDALRLKMKYDDGFVAYLNGTEVVRRNAPAGQTWNSAASASRADADALVYETIELPRSALRSGSNILAIHGLNDAASGTNFLVYPELEALRTQVGVETYFTPTPGVENGTGTTLQFVADTKFSRDRGIYDADFPLAITTATAGAEIRYTTDGSAPTATTGTVYTGPINITTTTTVRAAAFKPGLEPSNVDTQSYIRPDKALVQGATQPGWPTGSVNGQIYDYEMDPDVRNAAVVGPTNVVTANDLKALPSISIVLKQDDLTGAGQGIYSNPGGDEQVWERAASIELLNPDGSEGFQSNVGLRIRGGFSRDPNNPKHGFRLFFRGEYGDSKLEFPMFGPTGADEFQKFDLRTANNYSWSYGGDSRFTYLRDQFSRDTQLEIAGTAERGDYYHLYLNGVYWGIYNSDERAESNFGASYFGGDADDYDVVKVDPDLGYNIEATDGNMDAWNEMYSFFRNNNVATEANYQRLLGNNPDGTRNPAYEVMIDPDNLIDYMLVIYYGGNLDAPISAFLGNQSPNNFFALRNREGAEGWRFYAHDAEHTLLSDDPGSDRTGPFPAGDNEVGKSNPQWLFQKLIANASFKAKFTDHVQEHFTNGGALTPAAVAARLNVRVGQLDGAIRAESARWGDSKVGSAYTRDTWRNEVNRLIYGSGSSPTSNPNPSDSWVERRTGIVLSQFAAKGWLSTVNAPTFSRPAGVVLAGTQVSLATDPVNAGGTIYYTLDGSDPRAVSGSPSVTAVAYTGPIAINQTRTIVARVLSGGVWSAANQRTYSLDTGSLRVSQLMYNPPVAPAGPSADQNDYEFVELLNTGASPIDLTGMRFSTGIVANLSNPGGNLLAAGGRAVVVRNVAAFQSRYGSMIPIAGTYGSATGDDALLGNGGERLVLVGAAGQTLTDFTYSDAWYPLTDDKGFSLVAINPAGPDAALSTKQGWRMSQQLTGNPGAADVGVTPGSVVINELVANTNAAIGDWIELHNTTGAAIAIGGWFLSDKNDVDADLRRYQFPAGTTIAAGDYLVLNSRDHFGTAGRPGVNTAFGLSDLGESVYLSSNDGAGNAGGYRESVSFDASEAEQSFGRYVPGGPDSADFAPMLSPTPDGPNSGPRVGPVVINEIMYNPTSGKAEYFELRNLSNLPVPLYDPLNPANRWTTKGLTFTFPAGKSIPAKGYVVVAAVDEMTFRAQYLVPPGVQVFGGFTGMLANEGERLTVFRPGVPQAGGVIPQIAADAVKYDVLAPWPVMTATTQGLSLSRINSGAFGTDAANFAFDVANGTPGRLNFDAAGPVADVVDVTPDPRTAGVDVVTIAFDEPVSGIDLADLRLTFNGADVPLASGASGPATLTSSDGITYALGNLVARTATPGAYVVTVTASGSGIADYSGRAIVANASDAFTVVPATSPSVASVVVNTGQAQRSMVKQLTVGFDRDVVLDAGAITLVRPAAGSVPALSIPLTVTPATGVAATYTLAFPAPYNLSLPDGVYTLTVAGAKVHAGSATGQAMAADYAKRLHRLYGDDDGDGDMDAADLFQLRSTVNKPRADPAYKWWFDYDDSGTVDAADLFQLRSRTTLQFKNYG